MTFVLPVVQSKRHQLEAEKPAIHDFLWGLTICIVSVGVIEACFYAFRERFLALVGYHAVLLLGLMLAGRPIFFEKRRLDHQTCLLILAGLGAGPALVGVLWLTDPSGTLWLGLQHVDFSSIRFAIYTVYLLLINPFLEESFWRGDYAIRRVSFMDVLYAVIHIPIFIHLLPLPLSAVIFLSIWGAGALWRVIARRTSQLRWAIAGHFLADASLILGFAFLASR